MSSLLLLLEELAASGDSSGSSGGDETSLHTAWSVSSDSGWVTNVLMVTTTMRMLDWVHSYTSDTWPVSLLSVGFVVRSICLEKRLFGSLSTSDDSDHGSACALDGLSHTRWHSDTGLLTIFGVADDDSTGARGSGEGATVTHLGFDIGDDGSFWHAVDRDHIADRKSSY